MAGTEAATTETNLLMASQSNDAFQFDLIGAEKSDFLGYMSSEDPTKVAREMMIRGSQNVLLRDNGNIGPREGKLRYDPADNTDDGVVASFDWQDVDGDQILVRVLESGSLQFYRESNQTWYTIAEFPDATDFSFAKWWDNVNAKELLLMANGANAIYAWPGGTTDGVGEVNSGNSIYSTLSFSISSLSFTNIPDGIQAVTYDPPVGDIEMAIVFEAQPDAGQFLVFDIASTAFGLAETSFIEFVDALGSPATPNVAQVLIGATKEATAANVLALLQDPSADSATQVGWDDTNTVTMIDFSTYALVDALESGNDQTWLEQGFIDNSSIIIDGVTYTYDLVAGDYLVNISAIPPQDTYGYSGLTTTSSVPTTDYAVDFILVLSNQLATFSFTDRVVYLSSDTDYTDFSNAGDYVPGDPDFVILDEFPTGGIVRGDSMYVGSGNANWYEITPNSPIEYVATVGRLVIIKVTKFVGAGLTAPLGPNFITTLGEDIIYIGQDNQLRTLGIYRNVVQQKSPALSLAVREELKDEDFTGGCLRAIDEYTYLVAPLSGKVYMYEIRDDVDEVGNITADRHWQPPQILNISRLAIVNGEVHGYSSSTPQLFQLRNTNIWHDQTSVTGQQSPYISVARFAYSHFGDRNRLGVFDKVYYEGYIEPYSDLRANVYYDYRGATRLEENVLSSTDSTPVLYGGEGIVLIGGATIGNTTIGGGRRDLDYGPLPKFRAITNVVKDNCFEYNIELVSEEVDARWEIISLGANAQAVTDNPVNIQLST
jgi:hypothetical protein